LRSTASNDRPAGRRRPRASQVVLEARARGVDNHLVSPVAALKRDARVVVPEMLLRRHAFEGAALRFPDLVDGEQDFGPPAALLGLVRLEEEDRRGADRSAAGRAVRESAE